jgi:hypothetical protein
MLPLLLVVVVGGDEEDDDATTILASLRNSFKFLLSKNTQYQLDFC